MTWLGRISIVFCIGWAQEPFFRSTGFLYLEKAQYEAAALAFDHHARQTSDPQLIAIWQAAQIYAYQRSGKTTLAQNVLAAVSKHKKLSTAQKALAQTIWAWLSDSSFMWQKIFLDTAWVQRYPASIGWLLLESVPSDTLYISALQTLRKVSHQPLLYSERLLPLYEKLGQYTEALKELLLRYEQDSTIAVHLREKLIQWASQLPNPYVLEKPLLQQIIRNPNQPMYVLWLVDFYLAVGDFAQAMVQAKALLRFSTPAFTCEDFLGILEGLWYRGQYTWVREGIPYLLQQNIPCKRIDLVLERWAQLQELSTSPLQVVRRLDSLLVLHNSWRPYLLLEKARWLLRAGEITQAQNILLQLESLSPALVPQKELLLSDVDILAGRYIDARLRLLQIESAYENSYWAYLANFKLAELAYYQGEFTLAQTRLRILKENTFSDLSNDAIQLYWLIEDNLVPDTLTQPLQLFAIAQLYIMRGYKQKALQVLDSIERQFKGHPITDDVFMQKAQLYLEEKDTTAAMLYFKLLADYPDQTLYRDDALYYVGLLWWQKDPTQALKYWERLILEPQSLYTRIVKERLQELRR